MGIWFKTRVLAEEIDKNISIQQSISGNTHKKISMPRMMESLTYSSPREGKKPRVVLLKEKSSNKRKK